MTPSILLVDRDRDGRTILGVLFRHYGYHVVEAETRTAALELARAHQPDLVIGDFLDLREHAAFVDALRAEIGSAAPILCLTAWASREDMARARELADAVLSKPVHPARVAEEARRLLTRDGQPA